MLLTTDQLHEIKEIIRNHHSAFVVNYMGAESVPPEVLEKLKELGLVSTKVNSIEDAYMIGQVVAAMEDPRTSTMSYDEFKAYLAKNPIPLSRIERQAMEFAQHQAAQYAHGLGNRVDLATGQILIEADSALRSRLMGEIQTATAENIARRESVGQLKSALGHATEDWSRNWDRIAITEKHSAMQRGAADHYAKKHGPDSLVALRPMPDACPHCRRLNLDSDGQPKIFKLSELEANGTNYGRKAAEYLPVVGSVHPNCQCQLVRVPDGYGFDETGSLVPGGTTKKSMQSGIDLRKGFELQGHANFQGLQIAIENKAGTYRKWKDADGNEGQTLLAHDYGYVKGTSGDDVDGIDVFLGPNTTSQMVYIVRQQNAANGMYDEVKTFLGFRSQDEAVDAYLSNYDSKGPEMLQTIEEMDMGAFKRWIAQSKPRQGEGGEMIQKSGMRLVIPLQKSAGPFIGPRGGKWADAAHTVPWKENETPTNAALFSEEWLSSHPHLRNIHDAVVRGVVSGEGRGTEAASYEKGKIILKPEFWKMKKEYGTDFANHLYAHELGHGVEHTLGKKWADKAVELGVDVWDTETLPLGQFNQDEAFAETAAVIIRKDKDGLKLLDDRWPKWRQLVTWGLSELNKPNLEKSITRATDPLEKKMGHKYFRRIPTGKPGRKWKYIYTESSQQHGTKAAVGEKIKLTSGEKLGHYEVTTVNEMGWITLKHDESGTEMSVKQEYLDQLFLKEYKESHRQTRKELEASYAKARESGSIPRTRRAKDKLQKHKELFPTPEAKAAELTAMDMSKLAQRENTTDAHLSAAQSHLDALKVGVSHQKLHRQIASKHIRRAETLLAKNKALKTVTKRPPKGFQTTAPKVKGDFGSKAWSWGQLEGIGDEAMGDFQRHHEQYLRWKGEGSGPGLGMGSKRPPPWTGGETDGLNQALSVIPPTKWDLRAGKKDMRVSGPREFWDRATNGVKKWTDPQVAEALEALRKVEGFENVRLSDAALEYIQDVQTKEYEQQLQEEMAEQSDLGEKFEEFDTSFDFGANVGMQKGGGPFIGPRGGKWADSKHTIPWEPPNKERTKASKLETIGAATVTESGVEFKTGQPVTFNFVRNTGSSPKPSSDDRFQQKIEPVGRYMTFQSAEGHKRETLSGHIRGEVTFKKPLVLYMNTGEGRSYDENSWKARLQEAYKKKGKALSRAIAKDGFDGIVTVETSKHQPDHTSEIVDLRFLHTGVIEKAITSTGNLSPDFATEFSQAGNRNPGPGTMVNYLFSSPPKPTPPVAVGYRQQKVEAAVKHGMESMKRDRKDYAVQNYMRIPPKTFVIPAGYNKGFEKEREDTRVWLQEYEERQQAKNASNYSDIDPKDREPRKRKKKKIKKEPVELQKGGGPFIGPRGGKWADSKHTIPWKPEKKTDPVAQPDLPQRLDRTIKALATFETKRMDSKNMYKAVESKKLQEIGRRLHGQLKIAKESNRDTSATEERLKDIREETTSRREYYNILRRKVGIEKALKTGKIYLSDSEISSLLGNPGDRYADHNYRGEYNPDLFTTSDLTGVKIRHYIKLPDGRTAHPDEIKEARKKGRIVIEDIKIPIRDWSK